MGTNDYWWYNTTLDTNENKLNINYTIKQNG